MSGPFFCTFSSFLVQTVIRLRNLFLLSSFIAGHHGQIIGQRHLILYFIKSLAFFLLLNCVFSFSGLFLSLRAKFLVLFLRLRFRRQIWTIHFLLRWESIFVDINCAWRNRGAILWSTSLGVWRALRSIRLGTACSLLSNCRWCQIVWGSTLCVGRLHS